MCVKMCPFNAIQIVNLPTELNLSKDMLHSYGQNCFRLYRIPTPKTGKIFGIIGQNGVGKSTLLGILNGTIKPNFGNLSSTLTDDNILKLVRGTELQKYFTSLYTGKLKIRTKKQNIEKIQRIFMNRNPNLIVGTLINKNHDKNNSFHDKIINTLDLKKLYDYKICNLSGGEMQRLSCAIVMMKEVDVYIFDEPTNYLDIKQRLLIANLIRDLIKHDRYIFIVEHDMSILDYTSDIITILYGTPGAYGIVSTPYATSDAINIYFNGYIPSENMRFRSEPYKFKENMAIQYEDGDNSGLGLELEYNHSVIEYDNFKLCINSGKLPSATSMVVLMGKNGTGKTTMLNKLASDLELKISYKSQYIDISKYQSFTSVKHLLFEKIKKSMCSDLFLSDVINTLGIKDLYDRKIEELSGGELQKLEITLCLGEDAHVYLIDEPSACLDVEQRVLITKIIKRFLIHNNKIGFIVEHDIMMAISFGVESNTRIIVFDETIEPNEHRRTSTASSPMIFTDGINIFLKQLNITFRTDYKIRSQNKAI